MIAIKRKRKKAPKKIVWKGETKFEDYKNCLELNRLENKGNYLEKNKIEVENLKENQNEFLKNDRLILIAIN